MVKTLSVVAGAVSSVRFRGCHIIQAWAGMSGSGCHSGPAWLRTHGSSMQYSAQHHARPLLPAVQILRRRGLWYDTWLQDISRNLEGMEEPDKLPFAKCTDVG